MRMSLAQPRSVFVVDAASEAHRAAYRALCPHVDLAPRPTPDDPPIVTPAAFTREPTRHLLYHIYPHSRSDNWRWNCRQLIARIEMFDGVRSIGVATDGDTATLADVEAMFAGVRIDNWFEVANQPMIGEPGNLISDDGGCALLVEGQTFLPLMLTIPRGPDDVTFFAHAKGMRYTDGHLTLRWASMMYRTCLDDWDAVHQALSRSRWQAVSKGTLILI